MYNLFLFVELKTNTDVWQQTLKNIGIFKQTI